MLNDTQYKNERGGGCSPIFVFALSKNWKIIGRKKKAL